MATPTGELLDLAQEIRRKFPPADVNGEHVDAHYDELPLLSAEEFRLRLPAYLLRSIEKWNPKVETCEFTIYGVSPDKNFLESHYWAERYGPLSDGQIDVVLHFLDLAAQDEDFSFIFSEVKRAPERIKKLRKRAI